MTTLALLPNLAGPDLLLIVLIATFLFGAKKLPELARSLRSSINEFQKGKDAPSADASQPEILAAEKRANS